ncbi:MAG: ABC transporter ATP-binding protein [Gammaproteobacteria bacterium]|nr:ABC transporter ATP-binding protein [Rhodocyclaceae bacterium]MBU3907566.1 ABC transporter ATP-binding protein [Gammaproteobacteria bacterium]MBU3988466.1 ABC transporter ATP-binding protein [Gammaproteobacteria bacterium]MBU4004212.1 ABC transporter ATP-binding protein [Gammaproteobacteria bacterium]MBU4019621.1 ABC transporter ATP-binding protein [Gammaproteobacteria bacterium]
MNPLLAIEALQAAYGASQVLFDINLTIQEGQVATLLGRNGMGKTTTVRSICGLTPVCAGKLELSGFDLTGLRPDLIARQGIALVPEGRQIFANLTVREHLIAFFANRFAATDPWTAAKVFAFFPQLAERQQHLGNQLSGGEQQMLAIGRALTTNPRLLILDEATEGLAPLIREEIWRCLAVLRDAGQTILVIDKYVERLITLADHHTIIEKGRVVWHGSSAMLDADHNIWHRYLGI